MLRDCIVTSMKLSRHVKHENHSGTLVMFVIMVLAGAFSTMNVWVDKLDDVRLFHLNDVYMILLMTGWMFFFMGLYYANRLELMVGTTLVILMLVFIRYQLFIDQNQFVAGMIPHHSMAVLMSKQLLAKNAQVDKEVLNLAQNIVTGQEDEIRFMKRYVA